MQCTHSAYQTGQSECIGGDGPPAKIPRSSAMRDVHDDGKHLVERGDGFTTIPSAVADDGAVADAMPTVSTRDVSLQPRHLPLPGLSDLPADLQRTIWKKIDTPTLRALSLVSKAVTSGTSCVVRGAMFKTYSDTSRLKPLPVRISRLTQQWKKYAELDREERKEHAALLLNDTLFCMITDLYNRATPVLDVCKCADQTCLAIRLLRADKFFDDSEVFSNALLMESYFLPNGTVDLCEDFLELSKRTQAEVYAKVKSRALSAQGVGEFIGELDPIISWTNEARAEDSFRKLVAEAMIDLLPRGPHPMYKKLLWPENFLVETSGIPDEKTLNFRMLCRFIEYLPYAKLSPDIFVAAVQFAQQQCGNLPENLDASLRYRIRALCISHNHPPGELQHLIDGVHFNTVSPPTEPTPAEKQEIVRSALRGAISSLNIGQWIDLYETLSEPEKFDLLWSVQRSDFSGVQKDILKPAMFQLCKLFPKFPEEMHAKLLQKIGDWHMLDCPDGSFRLNVSSMTLDQVKAFGVANKQVALCGLATMIANASDSGAEYHADLYFDYAQDLPAGPRAKVALAILRAQQARLSKTSLYSYEKIALLAQELPDESAEAMLRELRLTQALFAGQTRIASIQGLEPH